MHIWSKSPANGRYNASKLLPYRKLGWVIKFSTLPQRIALQYYGAQTKHYVRYYTYFQLIEEYRDKVTSSIFYEIRSINQSLRVKHLGTFSSALNVSKVFLHHSTKLLPLIYFISFTLHADRSIFCKLLRNHVPRKQIDIRRGPIAGKLTMRNRNSKRPRTFHSNFFPGYILRVFSE